MEFFLFTSDAGYARAADEMGMDALIVDWEQAREQAGNAMPVIGSVANKSGQNAKRQIRNDSLLSSIRAQSKGHIVCRVDNDQQHLQHELEMAVGLGADEILLPMVRSVQEIENCLKLLAGKAGLGIMAESREIISLARELEYLPLTRVFFGLNDYQIETGKPTTFTALIDGDVDTFRNRYSGPFAVAGMTNPRKGFPIAQTLLLAEMVRLDCSFAVGRNAFKADVPSTDIGSTLYNLRQHVAALGKNKSSRTLSLRQNLIAEIEKMTAVPA